MSPHSEKNRPLAGNRGQLRPLLAASSYSWRYKLRSLNSCFEGRSGSSNLGVGYSCVRPITELGQIEIEGINFTWATLRGQPSRPF